MITTANDGSNIRLISCDPTSETRRQSGFLESNIAIISQTSLSRLLLLLLLLLLLIFPALESETEENRRSARRSILLFCNNDSRLSPRRRYSPSSIRHLLRVRAVWARNENHARVQSGGKDPPSVLLRGKNGTLGRFSLYVRVMMRYGNSRMPELATSLAVNARSCIRIRKRQCSDLVSF